MVQPVEQRIVQHIPIAKGLPAPEHETVQAMQFTQTGKDVEGRAIHFQSFAWSHTTHGNLPLAFLFS